MSEALNIIDLRHGDKANKDIRPEDIKPEDVLEYRKQHQLGEFANDEIIKQLIIDKNGGSFYAQENWDQSLNSDDKSELTYGGIRHAQEFTDEIFKQVELSPRGKICIFTCSPADRTRETMAVIEDRVNDLMKKNHPERLQVLKLESLNPADFNESVLQDSTYFIFNHKPAEEIGPFSNETLSKVSKILGPSETVGEMLWFARPEELDSLKEELKKLYPDAKDFIDGVMPRDYQKPPEAQVMRIVSYYEQLISFIQQNFSDRQVDIYNVGHNMILDATTMRLLGFDISAGSVKKLGGEARDYLEGSKFLVVNGKITVKFRGLENTLSLEDLRGLHEKLQKEADERKKQWVE
jgi:hypothetical protein